MGCFSTEPASMNGQGERSTFFRTGGRGPGFGLVLKGCLGGRVRYFGYRGVVRACRRGRSSIHVTARVITSTFRRGYSLTVVISTSDSVVPTIRLTGRTGVGMFVCFPPRRCSDGLTAVKGKTPVRVLHCRGEFGRTLLPSGVALTGKFRLSVPAR